VVKKSLALALSVKYLAVTMPPLGPVTTTCHWERGAILLSDSIVNEVYVGELRAFLDGVFKEIRFAFEPYAESQFIPAAFKGAAMMGKPKGQFINLGVCPVCVWFLHDDGVLDIQISIRHVAFPVISAIRQLTEKECLQLAHGLVISAIESECELIEGADGDFNRNTGDV